MQREILRNTVGACLVVTGLLLNKAFIEIFVVSDGRIDNLAKVLVLIAFQSLTISLGVILLWSSFFRSLRYALTYGPALAASVFVITFVVSRHDTGLSPLQSPPQIAYSALVPRIIETPDLPKQGRAGGIIAVDVDGDGSRDLLVSRPGKLAAFRTNGQRLWIQSVDIQVTGQSEREGGGKPAMARGAGNDPSGIDALLEQARELLSRTD